VAALTKEAQLSKVQTDTTDRWLVDYVYLREVLGAPGFCTHCLAILVLVETTSQYFYVPLIGPAPS